MLALAAILIVGAVLRIAWIGTPSLWLDEIGSVEISTGRGLQQNLLPLGIIEHDRLNLTGLAAAQPWWKIWTAAADNVNPPLYYTFLRWWMDVLGSSPGVIRLL